jgi:hypothetical protein
MIRNLEGDRTKLNMRLYKFEEVHNVLQSDADLVLLIGLLEVQQSILEENLIEFEEGLTHHGLYFLLQTVIKIL